MTTLTEPAGWGEPGTVRHAEAIGHGVWVAEHPLNTGADGLDPKPVDDLEAWHDSYDPGGPTDQLIEKHFGTEAKCPIPLCVRPDHPVYELCEDNVGHTWFQGGDGYGTGAGGGQL